MFFQKQSPNVISYRSYKNFSNDAFRDDLINELCTKDIREGGLTGLLEACTKLVDRHTPKKKKCTRVNQASFLTKQFNKEVMTRSKLRNRSLLGNRFPSCRSNENKNKYTSNVTFV